MSLALAPLPILAFLDNNGNPLVGGKLFTYKAGTTIKQATFTDSTGGTPNTNPVILNARGECSVWMTQNVTYKLVLAPSTDTDPPTNPIWTQDNLNQGISNITSDVTPAVDATYSLGTTVLRWLNVIISGAFKIINSSFEMAILLGQSLTANRQLIIPDANLLIGGSLTYFQNSNYIFANKDAGATLSNGTAANLIYTLNSGIFLAGTEIRVEQAVSGGTVTVTAGAGVLLFDYKNPTAVSSITVNPFEEITFHHYGGDSWLAGFHPQFGSFTGTLTGMTVATTGTFFYAISGDQITIYTGSVITGTSNSTAMSLTGLPALIVPVNTKEVPCSLLVDNAVTNLGGSVLVQNTGICIINLARTDLTAGRVNLSTLNFTNVGTKGVTAAWSISFSRK